MALVLICHGAQFAQGGTSREKLVEAFEQTKVANTVDACTGIIGKCQAVDIANLSQKMVDYRANLLAWAHNRRGELYSVQAAEVGLDRGDSADLDKRAFADFDAAVRLDPSHWKPRHNRGVSHALQGNHEEAIADFSAALERKPEDLDTRFNRAAILAEVGRSAEALADYDALIREEPEDVGGLIGRAAVYARLGEFSPALDDCQKAIQADPKSAAAYTQRGRVYEQLGQWASAATDFRRAVELDRESGEAYLAAAWLMATCPDARFRNPALAIEAADRALILIAGPNRWRALDVAAAAYAATGKFDQAQQLAQRAIEMSPTAKTGHLRQRLEKYQGNKPFLQSESVTLRGQLENEDESPGPSP